MSHNLVITRKKTENTTVAERLQNPINIVDRQKQIDTYNIHIDDRSLYWLDTDTKTGCWIIHIGDRSLYWLDTDTKTGCWVKQVL